ncbi:hypothetical protein ACHAWT_001106, partial [Skeletonema menzelii]
MTGTSSAQSHEKEESTNDLSKRIIGTKTSSPQSTENNNNSNCNVEEINYHTHCSSKYNRSAAGKHFARKKSEGGHHHTTTATTLFHHLASRVGNSIGHSSEERRDELQEGQQDEEVNDVGEEDVGMNLSAAGEHFAKKRAEKQQQQQRAVVEKDEIQSVEIEENDDWCTKKHLSAAGEHFAKKRLEKKSERSPIKKRTDKDESAAENQVGDGTEIDNEAD